MNASGLGTQVVDSDGVRKALYNVIGAGRRIIKFAFKNDVGSIEMIDIDSDRKDGKGFHNLGVFYLKEEINNKYLSLEESGKKDQLRGELAYKKKNELISFIMKLSSLIKRCLN